MFTNTVSGRNWISVHIDPNHATILVTTSTVSSSEWKANLSRYLREVRRGGEVQVLD